MRHRDWMPQSASCPKQKSKQHIPGHALHGCHGCPNQGNLQGVPSLYAAVHDKRPLQANISSTHHWSLVLVQAAPTGARRHITTCRAPLVLAPSRSALAASTLSLPGSLSILAAEAVPSAAHISRASSAAKRALLLLAGLLCGAAWDADQACGGLASAGAQAAVVGKGQACHAWDEGRQQLLGAQLCQDVLVAGLLWLMEVEEAHAQACRVVDGCDTNRSNECCQTRAAGGQQGSCCGCRWRIRCFV